MADLFWCYRGGQSAPYTIEVARAADHACACAVFGEAPHANTVHRLTSPKLIAELRGLGEAHVICKSVARLPSAYDRFAHSPGPGHDYDAMEDAGFDVT